MTTSELTPQPEPGTAQPPIQRAMRFERGIYSALAMWLARHPDVPPGATGHAYVGVVAPTLWVWIGASVVEMALVHFLIPWPVARIVLLLISLWGLLWMTGFAASLVVHPHLVTDDDVRVRHAHTIDLPVPRSALDSVTTRTRSPESSRTVQTEAAPNASTRLLIAVSGQVNVHLQLTDPLTVSLPGGRYTFTQMSFWADDPAPLVERLRTGRNAA